MAAPILTRQDLHKARRENRGFLFNTALRFSSPEERYSAIIRQASAQIVARSVFGEIRYLHSNKHPQFYIRISVIDRSPAYVTVEAKLESRHDVDENKLPARTKGEPMVGVLATVEEIDDFLDQVRETLRG